MADSTIGKLLIQMALEDQDYKAGLLDATKATQTAAAAIGAANTSASKAAADAMSGMATASQAAGKALSGVTDEVLKATGAYRDAAGKLRDASGKFTTEEAILASVGKAANKLGSDFEDLGESASKLDMGKLKEAGQSLGTQLQSLSTTLRSYVADGFKIATAAAAGFIAASTYIGANFQQKMAQVGVVAGATGDDLGKLTSKARELGATTAFSASDAADAMNLLAGAGLSVNEVLTSTGDALTLAGAGGTTLDQSAQVLTSTMAQFNLTAGEAGRISDVLAKATAKSQFTVSDLGEALKYGGTVGAGFNWSLEQTVAALAQFRDLGLQGSQAGTALRSAMVGASTASAQNVKVLKEYGLTMEQISPETHSFADILTTVGKAGLSTSDAMVVFGAEAGAAVATLSRRFAEGGDSYNAMLDDLQNATGSAAQMYADMQKNVAGSFANLQSAVEEVFLTLFDQYSGPLADLLDSLSGLVNKISAEINARSFVIKTALLEAFGAVTKWIDDNGDYIATTIAGFVEDVADFATGVKSILPLLSDLLPLLDDIAGLMALIWVTTEVMAFVSAMTEVISAVTATGFSVQGLMVILTEATGGVYALVAGIGLLVAGLAALISRYYEAADAATKLKEAQDKLKQGEVTATQERAAALQGYLDAQRAAMKQEQQQLAASGQLNSARYKELQTLLDLTGSTAAQAEAEGKLVMVRGQLRTVGSIAQDLDPDDVAAFKQQVEGLSQSSAEASKRASELEQAILKAKNVDPGMYGSDALIQNYLKRADASVSTLEEAEARLQQLRQQASASNAAAINLQKQYDAATSAMLDEESRRIKQSDSSAVASKRSGTEQKVKLEREYVDQTIGLHADLQRQLQAIGASDEEQEALKLQEQQDKIRESYRKQEEAARTYYQGLITDAKGNTSEQARLQAEYEAEKLRLETAMQADVTLVADVAAKERAQREVEEARKAAAAKEEEEKRIYGIINELEAVSLKESERLAKEKADTLAGIDDSYGAEKSRISADYDKKIADAQVAEAKAAQQEIADHLKSEMQAALQTVSDVWSGIVEVVGTVKDSISTVLDTATGFVNFFADGLESLTGFSLDLRGAIAAVVDEMANASTMTLPGGGSASMASPGVPGGAASQSVSTAIQAAIGFVQAAIIAIPQVIQALVDQLPALIDALVAAIPRVLDSLIAGIPALVQMFVAEAPKVIQALAAALPQLVQALVDQLPVLFDSIVGMLKTIVPALMDAGDTMIMGLINSLPKFLIAVLDMIPSIISSLMAALPTIIKGLISGVAKVVVEAIRLLPMIIQELLDAVPDIITSLISSLMDAIPDIIMALMDAIPQIVITVTEAIPKIINAVLGSLPKIITTLISMIPMIGSAVIKSLPDIISAFIELIPSLTVGLIKATPQIIMALIDGLIIQMPQIIWAMIVEFIKEIPTLAESIGQAIWNGLQSVGNAIVGFFKDLWASLFGGGGDKDKGSAYSGIEYVPATMRMTVHQGEMVVPANRNPAGRGAGRSDPALAGGRGASPAAGGMAQQLQVLMNGRVVEEVMLESGRMGQSTGLRQMVRTTAGVKAGIDRGRYNRWNK